MSMDQLGTRVGTSVHISQLPSGSERALSLSTKMVFTWLELELKMKHLGVGGTDQSTPQGIQTAMC